MNKFALAALVAGAVGLIPVIGTATAAPLSPGKPTAENTDLVAQANWRRRGGAVFVLPFVHRHHHHHHHRHWRR